MPGGGPYIIFIGMSSFGFVDVSFDNIALYNFLPYNWENTDGYFEERQDVFDIVIASFQKSKEVSFGMDEKKFKILQSICDPLEGNKFGIYETIDSYGRGTKKEEYHATGHSYDWDGYTAAPGEWMHRVELDSTAINRTYWQAEVTYWEFLPKVNELGFNFQWWD